MPRPAVSPPAPEPAAPPRNPCAELWVAADHRGIPSPTVGIPRGVFELGNLGSGTAVEVLAPYRPTGSGVSASQAVIREFGSADQDEPGTWRLTVEWIGTLELEVVTPGCEPVAIRCGPVDCSVG